MRAEELEPFRASALVLTRKHFLRYKLLVTRFLIFYENILKNNLLMLLGTCSGCGQLCHSWLWCAKDPSSQPGQSSQCKYANIMNRDIELPLLTDRIFWITIWITDLLQVGREGCKKGVCTVYVNNEDMTAEFPHLGVQCVRRKDVQQSLSHRQQIKVGAKLKVDPQFSDPFIALEWNFCTKLAVHCHINILCIL